ncbi:MAG: hypothetical protein R3260_00265 [Pseudomonas sp.]|nr:hypothetical protein [Pseudomonas sp.]
MRQPRKLTDEFHLDYSDDEASRAEEHGFKMARRKINLAEIAAIIAGEEQGNKVSLHMPMGRDEKQLLIE